MYRGGTLSLSADSTHKTETKNRVKMVVKEGLEGVHINVCSLKMERGRG